MIQVLGSISFVAFYGLVSLSNPEPLKVNHSDSMPYCLSKEDPKTTVITFGEIQKKLGLKDGSTLQILEGIALTDDLIKVGLKLCHKHPMRNK